jgi:hypothetical protein
MLFALYEQKLKEIKSYFVPLILVPELILFSCEFWFINLITVTEKSEYMFCKLFDLG